MTYDEVDEFETLMDVVLGNKKHERPAFFAEREPYWMKAGKPRGEDDDPLAAVILNLFHTSAQYQLYAAYRCNNGEKIEPELMKSIILAVTYSQLHE